MKNKNLCKFVQIDKMLWNSMLYGKFMLYSNSCYTGKSVLALPAF